MTLEINCPNVRLCQEGDREKLFEFVRAGHEESAIFTCSDIKVKKVIDHAINPPRDENGNINHLVIIGIINTPDKTGIAASLAMEYSQSWYSDDWFLSELWNNVHKDYRKSTYAHDLINFGKWLSESTKRPLGMGIITTHRLEAKERLYSRKLPKVGAFFIHNLQYCNGPAFKENSL